MERSALAACTHQACALQAWSADAAGSLACTGHQPLRHGTPAEVKTHRCCRWEAARPWPGRQAGLAPGPPCRGLSRSGAGAGGGAGARVLQVERRERVGRGGRMAVALRERAQLRQPLRDRAREAVLARDVRGQDHVPARARALGPRSCASATAQEPASLDSHTLASGAVRTQQCPSICGASLPSTPCGRMLGGRAGAAAAGCCGACGPAAARCGRRSRPAPA